MRTGAAASEPAGPTTRPFKGGPGPRGSNEHVTRTGSAIRTRPDGRVSDIHDARSGMDVHHGLAGGRRVSVERADHSRVYAERGRRGYVERRYGYHGHDFGRRSYYYHGHDYNRYYRGYGYRGVYLNVYAPGYYYAPGFYGWAYNPWAVPIAFGWGWGRQSLVWILWRLLPALSGVSLGRVLADGLHHLAGSAGSLCRAPGSGSEADGRAELDLPADPRS